MDEKWRNIDKKNRNIDDIKQKLEKIKDNFLSFETFYLLLYQI